MRFYEIYKKYEEICNYLIVGFITTVLSLITYYFLTITFFNANNGILLQCANTISWIVGVLFAYFANRKYVFKSKDEKKLKEFFKFVSGRILTLIVDMLVMFVFVTLLKYNDQVIKIISQVIVILLNYIISKFFAFNNKKYLW